MVATSCFCVIIWCYTAVYFCCCCLSLSTVYLSLSSCQYLSASYIYIFIELYLPSIFFQSTHVSVYYIPTAVPCAGASVFSFYLSPHLPSVALLVLSPPFAYQPALRLSYLSTLSPTFDLHLCLSIPYTCLLFCRFLPLYLPTLPTPCLPVPISFSLVVSSSTFFNLYIILWYLQFNLPTYLPTYLFHLFVRPHEWGQGGAGRLWPCGGQAKGGAAPHSRRVRDVSVRLHVRRKDHEGPRGARHCHGI